MLERISNLISFGILKIDNGLNFDQWFMNLKKKENQEHLDNNLHSLLSPFFNSPVNMH